MSSKPHQPARKVGGQAAAENLEVGSEPYPDLPSDEPGLVGGPATEAVPGSHRENRVGVKPTTPPSIHDPQPGLSAGGETDLSGRPRETGGERPPKKIPKTEGS